MRNMFFACGEIPAGKISVGQDQPECVDPLKRVSFDYNNA